ncbi:MAG: four helix bundle protein [Verrucomicrobia bacterium]|nr:four helix bundle protein [Verrucomicrobiota bacterium]
MNETSVRTFEVLECWKACRVLRCFVAKSVCRTLPKDERYRLGDQILRAARSATSNIAEGYGRFHYLDNAKFCSNARGSVWETLDHVIIAHDEELIDATLLATGRVTVANAIALLNGYISYLQRAAKERPEGPNNK